MATMDNKLDNINKTLHEISTLLKNLVLIQGRIATNLGELSREAKHIETFMKGMVDEND